MLVLTPLFAFWLAGCHPTEATTSDSGPDVGTEADPCPAADVAVTSVEVTGNSSMVLAQQLTARLTAPARVAFACQRADDPVETHLVEADGTDKATVDVAGLLASSTYNCKVAPICPKSTSAAYEFSFTTAALPADMPTSHVDRDATLPMTGGAFTLLNHSKWCDGDHERLILYDPQGRIRWYDELPFPDLNVGIEAEYEGGGHFFWGAGDSTHGRPEIDDLYAQPIYKANFPGSNDLIFEHDARDLDTADMMLSLHYTTNTDDAGNSWTGFGLILHDPTDDSIVWNYSSQEGFDEGLLPGASGGADEYHGNATTMQQVDGRNVAYMSLYNLAWIIAIDTTDNHILWRFGNGGDFTLLAPDGTPLGSDEFMQGEHGIDVDGDKVIMYDNGYSRGYSRAVQYTLDTVAMTATEDWTWTDSGWYEPALGDVDWLPDGHILVSEAHIECYWPHPGRTEQFVEVDVASGKPLWRLTYEDINDAGYRAQRVDTCDVFADAEYCVDAATELARVRPQLGL